MDRDEAYSILGVKEDASRSEIEKKYAIILRKYRSENDQDRPSKEEFERITKAYNVLMGYEVEPEEDASKKKKPNPVLLKLGIDEDKLKNNLYYFRYYIIAGIIALIMIITTVRGCVNRVVPDLYVVFMGRIYCSDTDQLEEIIKSNIEGVKEVTVENLVVTEEQQQQDPQMYISMLQKVTVLIATGDLDVLILDKTNFDRLSKQGALAKLDELMSELNLQEDEIYRSRVEKEELDGTITVVEEGIYGIDVKSSRIFSDTKTAGNEMIAAISAKPKHYENAVDFLKLLIENTQE